jgi:hypothetical protein
VIAASLVAMTRSPAIHKLERIISREKVQAKCQGKNAEPAGSRPAGFFVVARAILISAVLTSSRLGEQRQDTVGDVDSNDL